MWQAKERKSIGHLIASHRCGIPEAEARWGKSGRLEQDKLLSNTLEEQGCLYTSSLSIQQKAAARWEVNFLGLLPARGPALLSERRRRDLRKALRPREAGGGMWGDSHAHTRREGNGLPPQQLRPWGPPFSFPDDNALGKT